MYDRVVLAGGRPLQAKDKIVGVPEPGTRITVGLYLMDPTESQCRPGSAEDFAALDRFATRAGLAGQRQTQYAEAARQTKIFAEHHGLRITDVDFAKRRILLTGTLRQMTDAFETKFVSCRTGRRAYRSHVGPVQVPRELALWTRGVLGLDTRPRLRRRRRAFSVNAQGAAATLWPADIARLYGIAAPSRGAGQCISIVAPRGGYLADDLMLAQQHVSASFPQIIDVGIDLGRNKFAGGTLADQELALDLQVAGAAAPPRGSLYTLLMTLNRAWPMPYSRRSMMTSAGPT